MDGHELKSVINEFGISQAEFSSLIDVTPRAVTLWISGERPVPGPVKAYIRVLKTMNSQLRQIEFSSATKETVMRDGMYTVEFGYEEKFGFATLIFDHGQIYGIDAGSAVYDGEYQYENISKTAEAKVKITFPKNGLTVFGDNHPYEWSIDVVAKFNPHADQGNFFVETSLGHKMTARFRFVRPIPRAA